MSVNHFLLFFLLIALGQPRPFSSAQEPFRTASRLSKPLIGKDGRIYACSDMNLYSFESNGSIVWTLRLGFKCNMATAPVHGGRGKIYLIAENRVLKINFLNIGTSEPAVQVFFGPGPGQPEQGEIVGVAVSTLSSAVFINVKNRGLFAYMTRGQLLWSTGPVLNQFGYQQGCRGVKHCYFTSVPVIDQCEASLYMANTRGELYSLSLRSPHFKWIQDLSMFDEVCTVTPGNNGRLYVTVPVRSIVLALDVSSGNILWQNSVGPLSSSECAVVVDSYGWISIGSLDGFLYSFSPNGVLKKFPKAATLDSVIQVSPFLDCSGYALYICQTEMEGKVSRTIGEYTYVSALKPKSVAFTLMVPSTGAIYWSESYPGQLSSLLAKSDLQNFVVDEGILLAFLTASKAGNRLPCRSPAQKLASSCSQVGPKRLSIYTGNARTILLFLLLESLLLVALAAGVRFCCIFWKKKKLQGRGLGSFLEKRRSLQLKKKAFDRTITELEKKAAEEAVGSEVIEKIGDLVRERQGIERKLSTTYSLGRDRAAGSQSKSSPLPLYDGRRRTRSYSFQSARKESVTLFHTLSDTSSRESSSDQGGTISDSEEEEKATAAAEAKGKTAIDDTESSSSDGGFLGKDYRRSPSEPASSSKGFADSLLMGEEREEGELKNERKMMESMPTNGRNLLLKRRKAMSSTN